jgi:hypothetical protein
MKKSCYIVRHESLWSDEGIAPLIPTLVTSWSERSQLVWMLWEGKNLLPLLGIEPRFLGARARDLIVVPTTLSRLLHAHTHARARTHAPTTSFLLFSLFSCGDAKLWRIKLLFKLMCMLVYFFCGYYCISWYFLKRTCFVKSNWTVTVNEYICKGAGGS